MLSLAIVSTSVHNVELDIGLVHGAECVATVHHVYARVNAQVPM